MRNVILAFALMACLAGTPAVGQTFGEGFRTIQATRSSDQASAPKTGAPKGGASQPLKPPSPRVGKTILHVPPDPRIAMLGVHQAAGSSRSATHSGTVVVNVSPGKDPLVLVLASHETVTWMVFPRDRKIAAVLLSGSKESSVYGQGAAEVAHIGSRATYQMDSPEFQDLQRDVVRYVGSGTLSFQGAYEASRFQVQ